MYLCNKWNVKFAKISSTKMLENTKKFKAIKKKHYLKKKFSSLLKLKKYLTRVRDFLIQFFVESQLFFLSKNITLLIYGLQIKYSGHNSNSISASILTNFSHLLTCQHWPTSKNCHTAIQKCVFNLAECCS